MTAILSTVYPWVLVVQMGLFVDTLYFRNKFDCESVRTYLSMPYPSMRGIRPYECISLTKNDRTVL